MTRAGDYEFESENVLFQIMQDGPVLCAKKDVFVQARCFCNEWVLE